MKEEKIRHITCRGRVAILFFILLLHVKAFTQGYNFRIFNGEDGMSQSFIYSVIQDTRGYLWISTGNGLSRYDGMSFRTFTTADSLADNFITCSALDGEMLWFGHNNGMITCYDGKVFHAIRLSSQSLSRITHIANSPDGRLWISTYSDGLLTVERETGDIKQFLFKEKLMIRTFEFLDDDILLAGTNSGLIACRPDASGGIGMNRPVGGIPVTEITCIKKKRDGNGFYVSTENEGIFELSFGNQLFKVSRIEGDRDFRFQGVQAICEDYHSDLWLATFGNGLIYADRNDEGEITNIRYFNTENGFSTDNVKTVYEDREGNIWNGSFGAGLTRITPRTFTFLSFNKRRYGNDIFSICTDGKFEWAGTESGLVKFDPGNGRIEEYFSRDSGLPGDSVVALYRNGESELWIGTDKNGVYRMNTANGKLSKFEIGGGVLENSVTCIEGTDDLIWLGTKKGLCRINTLTGDIRWFTIFQGGLPHNYVRGLFVDRSGKVWISTRSNTLAYMRG